MKSRQWLVLVVVAMVFGLSACGGGGGSEETPDVTGDVIACETADDCVTDNPCQAAACEGGICVFTAVEGTCDDGDNCTTNDTCVEGVCQGEAVVCDDGLFCNGLELCNPDSGECVSGDAPVVDDGFDCTVDECDETADQVTHVADDTLCDDGDPCTTGVCDETAGCTYEPYDGECDDGDLCTENDICADGTCAGTPIECDDGEFCNGEESCDPGTGECVAGDAPELDDGVACTVDECDEENDEVTHETDDSACDDENQCTTDTCDATEGCQYENFEGDCDDGDACTEGDVCEEGVCIPGAWICFEDCTNEIDDDLDTFTDCDDPDCTFDIACQEDGETCDNAYILNLGEPLVLDGTVEWTGTTEGAANDYTGSCSEASGGSPDLVHALALAEPLALTITVDFEGDAWPALYILDATCTQEYFCDAATSSEALETMTVLPAGTYHIVVDGNFVDGDENGDAGPYTLTITAAAPAESETDCGNLVDDDGDGAVDCADDECVDAPECIVLSGEDCAEALPLFDEDVTDTGETWTALVEDSTLGMDNDLAGTCDEDTGNAPDAVYTFTLTDPMWLDASHDFEDVLYPGLYLLDGDCDAGVELACAKAFDGAAEISLPLAAGTYYLVVDGSYGQDAGPYALSVALSPLAETETDCANDLDDDMDGQLDCDDEDCTDDPACVGIPGDACDVALPINEGQALGVADEGVLLTYNGTTDGLNDDYAGPCDDDTLGTPDAVYELVLTDPMTVTLTHDFDGNLWPAIYVLSDACDPAAMVYGCETAFSNEAILTVTLPAGTFYVVLDGSFEGDAGAYIFTVGLALPPTEETECGNGLDDDMDTLVDCDDDDCAADLYCADPYEPNNTLETASDLGEVGGVAITTGDGAMVYGAGDQDWFMFNVTGPGFIMADLTATELDSKLSIVDGDGLALDSSDTGGAGEGESAGAAAYEAGTFYVLVEGFGDSTGEYTLSLVVVPAEDSETDCGDGQDNDLDTLVDCDDDECADSALCGAGDTCDAPNLIAGGEPIDSSDDGLQLDYAGTTVGYANDYSGTCSAPSAEAADAVWKMVLGEEMTVSGVVDFEGYLYPSIYLFAESCDGVEVACAAGNSDPLSLSGTLPAGTYYIIVDGNWAGDESPYTLSILFSAVQNTETDCGDGVDNDNDTFVDCADDDCAEDPVCAGQNCGFPYLVNDGVAVGAADDGLVLTYEGDTTGFSNDYAGSCATPSNASADAVYKLELTDDLNVAISHDYEGYYWPALYVLAGDTCDPADEILCGKNTSDPAQVSGLLTAGTYYVIVDGNFAGDEAAYTLEFSFSVPQATETDCGDGVDNDGDNLTDCADDDCIADENCQGETCMAPLPVNEGNPITGMLDGVQLVYTGSTVDMADDYAGSCDEDTAAAPDAVYLMELTDAMVVTISHDFDGYIYPAVYVFDGTCEAQNELACAKANNDPAVIEDLVLDPGTYYIIVDASYAGDDGDYTLTIDLAKVPDTETDCGDGKDNDGDSLIDCCDDDCALDPICTESNCGDGVDNDCDTFTDCDDDECTASAFCVEQALPYSEDFEHEGLSADGWAQGGPDEECGWKVDDEGGDGTSYSMLFKYGGCSEEETYNLYSPWLDVSGCDEITVTFWETGSFLSWLVYHGVGIDNGVDETMTELPEPMADWAAALAYTFDVSADDSVRVFFGYLGDNADDWWIDQVNVECTQESGAGWLAGDVIITEYMPNPDDVSDNDGEWFEVYNPGDAEIDLVNCVISDLGADSHTIAVSTVVPAGGYAVFGNNADTQTNNGVTVDYQYSSTFLSNSEDEIIITCGEVVLDQVAYTGDWPSEVGSAIQLAPDHLDATDNDSADNWCVANAVYGANDKGTPGAANIPCTETNCSDQADEDLDGLMDCDDDDCIADPSCPEALCNDGADNDNDTFTDCDDDDCVASPYCVDTDEDGVMDAMDLCPGGDDNVDADENDLADACEVDWAGQAWPNGGTEHDVDAAIDIFVQVYKAGTTEDPGNEAQFEVTLLYKMDGDQDWTSVEMAYNAEQGNNYEYKGTVPAEDTVLDGTLLVDFEVRYLAGVDGVDYLYDGAIEDQANVAAPLSYTITGEAPPVFAEGDIIITEIMQNPSATGDDVGEWFEVYNTTDAAIDMEGWTIASTNDSDIVIANDGNGVVVPSLGYYVFAKDAAAMAGETVDYWVYGGAMNLGNSADALSLIIGDVTVDTVAWDNGNTFPDPNGKTMQLTSEAPAMTHTANDDGTNWCEATVTYATGDAGSPGAANESCL